MCRIERCGKLLVAASAAEIEKLAAIKAQAEANGVTDLVWLSGAEARALEPALVGRAMRCFRPRPASSTAMPSCWRFSATPNDTEQ